MNVSRPVWFGILLCVLSSAAVQAAEKKPELTEKQFGRLGVMLLEEPLGDSARDYAKGILIFAMQTRKAAVVSAS